MLFSLTFKGKVGDRYTNLPQGSIINVDQFEDMRKRKSPFRIIKIRSIMKVIKKRKACPLRMMMKMWILKDAKYSRRE